MRYIDENEVSRYQELLLKPFYMGCVITLGIY